MKDDLKLLREKLAVEKLREEIRHIRVKTWVLVIAPLAGGLWAVWQHVFG